MFHFLERLRKKDNPDKIFKELKVNKHTITDEDLNEYVKNMQIMAAEFIQTGQTAALDKLAFLMSCVDKERKALKEGIDQFIFRDDIDEFLKRRDIEESSIKLIELSDYPRRIPSEIQDKIKKTKKIYDKFYVLFTDYSGTVTKNYQREKEIKRKDKDPILFGTFQVIERSSDRFSQPTKRMLNDKFYVIGDWVDEYCDLTLDKFVQLSGKKDVVKSVETPVSFEEIMKELERIKPNEEHISPLV